MLVINYYSRPLLLMVPKAVLRDLTISGIIIEKEKKEGIPLWNHYLSAAQVLTFLTSHVFKATLDNLNLPSPILLLRLPSFLSNHQENCSQ
jgi:hypothetical protein